MLKFEVKGESGLSKILIGEKLANLPQYIPSSNVFIITDFNVKELYGDQFPKFPTITIGMTEKVKTIDTVMDIFGQLLEAGADRNSFLVGIGGGIVCDITGFVASIFMRGINFGFVSTTLLSQVDASVGGKNGVNFKSYKNLIGVFRQPKFVICDPEVLKTLSPHDLSCGFGEIIKHTLIADKSMFEYLEKNYAKALALDTEVINTLIYNSVEIKAAIVNRDEKEAGERRKLNYGHTFGHAIEAVKKIPHGWAVSLGIVIANEIGQQRNLLTKEDCERIKKLLNNLQLPTTYDVVTEEIKDVLLKDKKRYNDVMYFTLLNGIGDSFIQKIPVADLQSMDISLLIS